MTSPVPPEWPYAEAGATPFETSLRAAALDRLEGALAECAAVAAGMRLDAYRAFLGATVGTASPLLLDFCAAEGLAVDSLVDAMRPGAFAPSWIVAQSLAGTPVSLAKPPRHELERFALGGHLVRGKGHPRGRLGLHAAFGSLDGGFSLGPHIVRTSGDVGELFVHGALPEQVAAALVGRDIGALIDHPVLAGRGYVVAAVDADTAGLSPVYRARVEFRAAAVPWRPMWVRR